VGVEAEECNKIIRVQEVQVKEEMAEEPKEAAVNKREGRGRVNAANLKGTYLCSDEGKRALKMSDEGRKVSKEGILIRSLLGGSSLPLGEGPGQLEITEAASGIRSRTHRPIISYCTAS
jgi:hypothetical protein